MTVQSRQALIIGFVGRCNSGDELMLEMHLEILKRLGFEQVDIWTELVKDATAARRPLFWAARKQYELVVVGGGGLDIGYGFYPLSLAKYRYGATTIMSSINLPSHDDGYLNVLNGLCDCIITRKQEEYIALRAKMPALRFLPDVATTYCSPAEATLDRIAVVLRANVVPLLGFAPAEEFDVLVLSEWDAAASRQYASEYRAPIVELARQDPRTHVDALRQYRRVISAGRFHAALYAADFQDRLVYLYPTLYKELPEGIRAIKGRIPWAQIREVGQAHAAETKAGICSTRLAEYGRATKQQYLELFQAAMATKSGPVA